MSLKIKDEHFMNFIFPCKIQHNKISIINYLSEIYSNYYKRCNKIFDSYSFQELLKLPMIVANKIYSTITPKSQMTIEEFSNNLYSLFFGDIDDKMSMMFDILDFDGDGSIIYDDAFLILSHLHLIDYHDNKINYLEILISHFFGSKTKIEKENLFDLNENYDVLLLLLMFLNKHQSLISEEELSFYETSTKKTKNKNSDLTLNYLYTYSIQHNNSIINYEDLEYKPTNYLLDYLDIVDFSKKKKKVIDEQDEMEEERLGSDDEDLYELIQFSMDFKEVKERCLNDFKYGPKFFTTTFSSVFQEENGKKRKKREQEIDEKVDAIFKNQIYQKMKKGKMNHNMNLLKKKTAESFCHERTTQLNSTSYEIENIHEFLRIGSNNNNSNISFFKKLNHKLNNKTEMILTKETSKSTKKKMIKLILFDNSIFYFISFNRTNFLFKKILPIVNYFIHKRKVGNTISITLISEAHNHTIRKDYICENQDKANGFCSKLKNLNYQRDIRKDYYFKFEIDHGKFGHVFMARTNKDDFHSKKYAVKLVHKNAQSLEEYKINRNEIDIFKLLINIKHPNIVQCIDFYENESQIFFIFEYLPSGSLKKYLQDLRFFPKDYNVDTILKMIHQLIEGIYVLHKYGIIHRDIKTSNVMVHINSPIRKSVISTSLGISEIQAIHEDMSDITLKIIDFGLSKILGANEKTNEPYGTLSFKAPELIMQKNYDFKVDVWSLGITIYFIVYKVLPFEEGSREEIKKAIINAQVPIYITNLLSDINYYKSLANLKEKKSKEIKSSIIFSVLKDCLIKSPEKRFNIEELYYKYCKEM